MTKEMIEAAINLENAAKKYRYLYEERHLKSPVVYVKNDDNGSAIFISDSFNTKIIIACLKIPPLIIQTHNTAHHQSAKFRSYISS